MEPNKRRNDPALRHVRINLWLPVATVVWTVALRISLDSKSGEERDEAEQKGKMQRKKTKLLLDCILSPYHTTDSRRSFIHPIVRCGVFINRCSMLARL